MNRFLDPYGALGPVKRQIIGTTIMLVAVTLLFAWLQLVWVDTVVICTFWLYWIAPGPLLGDMTRIGVTEKALMGTPRLQELWGSVYFLALCMVVMVLNHQAKLGPFINHLPGHWPAAILIAIGPIPPMILRIRRASWLAWQAKMQPEAQA